MQITLWMKVCTFAHLGPNELKAHWPLTLRSESALQKGSFYLCKEETGSRTNENIWFPVQTCPLITHNLSLVQRGIHTQTQLKTCWFPSIPCSHSWPPSVSLLLESPLSTHLNPLLEFLNCCLWVQAEQSSVIQEWLTRNISMDRGGMSSLSIRLLTQINPQNNLGQVTFENVR